MALGRPATWTDPLRAVNLFGRLIIQIRSHGPQTLARWLHYAVRGAATSANTSDAAADITALLLTIAIQAGRTPAHDAVHLMTAAKAGLADAADPISLPVLTRCPDAPAFYVTTSRKNCLLRRPRALPFLCLRALLIRIGTRSLRRCSPDPSPWRSLSRALPWSWGDAAHPHGRTFVWRRVLRTSDTSTTSWQLDEQGLVLKEIDPRGNVDGADPDAFTTLFTHDVTGRLIEAKLPLAQIENNGQVATVQPITRFGYNTTGDQTHLVNPEGRVVVSTSDRLGRPTSATGVSYTPPGGAAISPTMSL
ncbi:hypothetical protein AB0J71_33065 [Nonomuraea sp. NPDC049637]|uniref:hypothetical protein n=1 Tax=Nonomuraea sp. NPDC049637 TaxID=3154356 RepID=UPI00343E3DE1